MITGAYSIIYSKNPEADRAFFCEMLKLGYAGTKRRTRKPMGRPVPRSKKRSKK